MSLGKRSAHMFRPVRLRGHLPRDPMTRFCIEQQWPTSMRQVALPRRRLRMFKSPEIGIGEKLLGKSLVHLELRFPTFVASLRLLSEVRTLELMVLCRIPQEIVGSWWRVVSRGNVISCDVLIRVEVVPRLQLQARRSVGIHTHEVKPIRRNSHLDLLIGAPITAFEQRKLPALFRQTISGGHQQRAAAFSPGDVSYVGEVVHRACGEITGLFHVHHH